MSDFNWREWNHEFLGWLLLIVGAVLYFFTSWTVTGSACLSIGFILTVDGLYQLWKGQDKGVLHELYISTIYKWEWVKKFNLWLDRLFGKEI